MSSIGRDLASGWFARVRGASALGFSLVEVLVALAITAILMSSVYQMLKRGQESAVREPEISALQQSARGGLRFLDRDLTWAGYKTPGAAAIVWHDGGENTPDEITIVYADPEVPISTPMICRRGLPCEALQDSSVVRLDPKSFDPIQEDPEMAYAEGMGLLAMETSDCNGDGKIGLIAFKVRRRPRLGVMGQLTALEMETEEDRVLSLLELPENFNDEIQPDCAVIGQFRIVQYRVYPLPPAPHPNLERRDLSLEEQWTPVAVNIENLQLMYAKSDSGGFVDDPPLPSPVDPLTWITQVKVTVAGRSETANLQGSSLGMDPAEAPRLRRSYSTTVSLRNVSSQVQQQTQSRIYN